MREGHVILTRWSICFMNLNGLVSKYTLITVCVLALPSNKKQIIIKEEQQDWSPSLDQEDPEPPHIKEEQGEVWTSEEAEQLQGLDEADMFTFTHEDEEKPQSSQFHADGEDYGGPESGPDTDFKCEDSSEQTDDSDGNWMETREPSL